MTATDQSAADQTEGGDCASLPAIYLRPALYKVLRSLEDSGTITSEWEFSNIGPARRLYRITALGDATLVGLAGDLEQARHGLTRLLERCAQVRNGHAAVPIHPSGPA